MKILVVGGGASGTMAALAAKKYSDADVVLLEKNEKIGKKLYITGKGRCNLTNDCSKDVFLQNVVSNPKFLYGAINAFDCSQTMEFFETNGCQLVVEHGNRVFPSSGKSSDVIKVLKNYAEKLGVNVRLNTVVEQIIQQQEGGFCINTNNGEFFADRLIIATGGKFYCATGSNGDGYAFAKSLGHSLISPLPSLIGIVTKQKTDLAGLSLKNVTLSLWNGDKKIKEAFGEMLFTHGGVSGPIVLTLSAYATKLAESKKLLLSLDLKPALSFEQLDKRILRDFEEQKNKQFKNSLNMLLPASLASYVVSVSNINPDKFVHEINRQERQDLCKIIKSLNFDFDGFEAADTAIVTSGGINTKEINPNTMESKLVKGLYFCGEVLDVDALTGGFNLQIAFSTGFVAGKSAATEKKV